LPFSHPRCAGNKCPDIDIKVDITRTAKDYIMNRGGCQVPFFAIDLAFGDITFERPRRL
jgi:hypothetical protein